MTPSQPDRRKLALGFVLGWVVLGWPWLSGSVTIPYDAKALFQAQLQFLATSLHTGQSPFWNPFSFMGMPQIADPQSLIFSPAALIAVAFETPGFQALDVYVLALLALGGLSTTILCKDYGWLDGAAWVAGLLFAFGGAAAWRMQHISQIQSYAFFAVSLCALNRALVRGHIRNFATAGVAIGMMLIEPNQVALLGCYVLVLIVLVKLFEATRQNRLANVVWGSLLTAAIALVICAIPLALTYLFLLQSNRPSVSIAEAAHGSLNPASILTFLIPDLFGARGDNYWGPYSQAWNPADLTLSQNMGQFYFGALPAMLILTIGLVRGHLWDRTIRIYSLVLVIALAYAVGTFFPAFSVAYYVLPGVAAFRRPVDALFLAGSMMSILSGYLLHVWLSGNLRIASHARRAAEVLFLFGVVVVALIVAWWQGQLLLASRAAGSSLLWLALASLFVLLPPVILRRKLNGLVIALTAFVVADLSFHNGPNESSGIKPTRVADVLNPATSDATIRFLKSAMRRVDGSQWRDRVEFVGMGFDWQNCASVHRLEATLGYNPFRLGGVSDAIGARDYNVGPDQRSFSPLFPSYDSMLARLLGLRFVVSSVPLEQIDPKATQAAFSFVRRTADGYIYESKQALPRALLVERAIHVRFKDLVKGGRWPADFDPKTAVLLSPVSIERPTEISHAASLGSVNIKSYRNDKVVLDATLNRDGYLVLHDLWHPWWRATIDGAPAEILKANVLFRALRLTKGVHRVTFQFAPFSGAVKQALRLITPQRVGTPTDNSVVDARF